MQVFLIRAARSNEQGCVGLTPRGREQAAHLAQWLVGRCGTIAPSCEVWTAPDAGSRETAGVIASALSASPVARGELGAAIDLRGVIRLLATLGTEAQTRAARSASAVLVCPAASVVELVGALLSPEQASALLLRAGEGVELEVRLAQPIGTARLVSRGFLEERRVPREAHRAAA